MSGRDLIISTGNILDKAINFNKGSDTAVEELFESLKSCIEEKGTQSTVLENESSIEIKANSTTVDNGDRQDQKITVKIFLYSPKEEIHNAIERGLKETSVSFLDTVVLSLGDRSESNPLTIEKLQSCWQVLEEFVENDKVKMIGLSDLDSSLFMSLHSLAKIKPSIVQINLATCCVVPPELSEFCKQQNIQLLTHSDPLNILPKEKLDPLLAPYSDTFSIKNEINSKWVVRYQVHLKTRGVLASKGFVVKIGI